MDTMTCESANGSLEGVIDRVCRDHTPLMITRGSADSAVLMSLEDYRSLEETAYLLSSPANAARLAESLAQATAGKVVAGQLAE